MKIDIDINIKTLVPNIICEKLFEKLLFWLYVPWFYLKFVFNENKVAFFPL